MLLNSNQCYHLGYTLRKSDQRLRFQKPHVGLVVTGGHEGLFSRSVITNLNRFPRDRMRFTIVCPSESLRALRKQVTRPDVEFLSIAPGFSQLLKDMRNAAFDLLYYHEVGTDSLNYFLAFFRLAPVQCTTWGIQDTSGAPEMDYYLSSRWTERQDADQHYSERLVLLDTLLKQPHALNPPNPGKTRGDFGVNERQHLYFCPQHLGKFHPDYDEILATILRQDGNGVLVVVEWPTRRDGEQLLARFRTAIPDVVDRVKVLPHLEKPDYLAMLQLSDVMIDPFHFSGVNTTYDALQLGKAVVTLPGPFQRGRFTLGCYRRMELMDCMAASEQDYVDKAVRLATDEGYRSTIEQRIREAGEALVDQTEVADEPEACWWRLAQASRHR